MHVLYLNTSSHHKPQGMFSERNDGSWRLAGTWGNTRCAGPVVATRNTRGTGEGSRQPLSKASTDTYAGVNLMLKCLCFLSKWLPASRREASGSAAGRERSIPVSAQPASRVQQEPRVGPCAVTEHLTPFSIGPQGQQRGRFCQALNEVPFALRQPGEQRLGCKGWEGTWNKDRGLRERTEAQHHGKRRSLLQGECGGLAFGDHVDILMHLYGSELGFLWAAQW